MPAVNMWQGQQIRAAEENNSTTATDQAITGKMLATGAAATSPIIIRENVLTLVLTKAARLIRPHYVEYSLKKAERAASGTEGRRIL